MCGSWLVCVVLAYGDHRDLHVLTHSFPTRRSADLSSRNSLGTRYRSDSGFCAQTMISSPPDSGQGSSPKVTRTEIFCAPSALGAGGLLASCASAGAASAIAAANASREGGFIVIS